MQKIYKVLKVAVAASLLSGVVLCGGCARDGILPVEEPTVSDAVGPDHVSVESALAALARFQADDPTTRSSDVPAVSHVDVLMRSEVSPATRTSGTAADAPLCYIAQFEGGGYAVLGADAKQGGVIAYVPQGRLTAADMAAAKAATDRGEDYETPTYIHACMVAYLEAAADGLITEQKAVAEDRSEPQTRWEVFDPDAPVQLMKTTWHQDYPYNALCRTYDGKQAKVGCVALTLGQILAYNMKTFGVGPDRLVPYNGIADRYFRPNWFQITKAIETATPASTYYYAIQSYLSELGKAVGMNYGVDMSTTNSNDEVIRFLKRIDGYKNVVYKVATLNDIKTQLRVYGTPVYASGNAQVNDDSLGIKKGGGHAWVIDGWQLKKVWSGTGDGIIGDVAKDEDYLYCRFGYPNAKYDGWYYHNTLLAAGEHTYMLTHIVYYTLN